MKPTSSRITAPKVPSGKGWGDGSLVRRFNKGRTVNPENTYTGFRPRVELEGVYFVIRNWCSDPRINQSFSSIFNSLLTPIKVACENTTEVSETGEVSIELNLGRIIIR